MKFVKCSLEFVDFRADVYRNFTKSCRINKIKIIRYYFRKIVKFCENHSILNPENSPFVLFFRIRNQGSSIEYRVLVEKRLSVCERSPFNAYSPLCEAETVVDYPRKCSSVKDLFFIVLSCFRDNLFFLSFPFFLRGDSSNLLNGRTSKVLSLTNFGRC